MGLMDIVTGALGGQASGQAAPQGGGLAALVPALLEMLGSQQSGGLAGLVQAFQEKGLGHVAQSWVGTGDNHPVSPDQLQAVLGDETLSQLATKSGIPADGIGGALAGLLPGLVDKLTPGGAIPEGGVGGVDLGSLLGSLGMGPGPGGQ